MTTHNNNRRTPFAVVVNDDPTQLNVLSGLVRKAGLEPRAFTAAEAALAEMSACAGTADRDPGALPALVVTDLCMPGIDGFRFCRLLRAPDYAAFNQVPILVVSATFTGDEPDRIAADLGADAFLPSPLDGKRFVEQVRAILKGTRVRNPLRVLIVEDSQTLAGMLKKAFEAHGYQADTALTARAAADAFTNTAYDVAVLDYHLPDGPGDVLLEAFRAERPDCVCLMMTTDPGPELALDWMKRGAAAYLHKPFPPDYLIELCAKARRERALMRVQELLDVRTRELRESEEKHRILLEESSDPIFSFTPEGHYTYVNRAFAEGVGKPVADIIGKSIGEVFPKEEADTRFASLSQVFRTGEEKVIEVRVPQADGERYYLTTITPIKDATGEVVSAICTSKDITERKRAEETLRKSEELLQEVGRIAQIGGWEMDFGTRKAQWTRTTYEIVGIEPGDPVPGPDEHVQYYIEEDRPRVVEAMRALIEDGVPLEFEARAEIAGRGIRWFRALGRAVRQNGQCIRLYGTLQDITERKRAEEALRESEARFRTAFENAAVGMALVSLDGIYLETNTAMARMIGYEPAELIGKPVAGFTRPEDLESRGRFIDDLLTGRIASGEQERRFVHRNGSEVWTLIWASVQRDSSGQPLNFVSLIEDNTSKKRAEDERKRLEAQLQQAQKMESVGRLAGGVAHDFNNMLGVILGHVELALMQVSPAQPLHADLEEIKKAAERSADLTRQLLAFARKQTVTPKVLDLNATVESMLKMLQRLIGENILLTWQPEAHLWPVRVDPSQIDQILANLCVNARAAIADVGTITIETGNRALDKAYCADHPGFVPGEYVRLAVSDTGCGMDQDTLAHIFEPFFTTKGVGTGTGLGLATVYGAVKQNNGFINVYSEPGQGTTFTLYLPHHAGKAGQARTAGAPGPALRGHETILLVEDEPAILTLTTRMLAHQGYTVLAARTPGEAIRLAREHAGELHLLMTDVVMPEMNGRDLAKNLLALYPTLKRLFMSGYTANVIAHHGVLDAGVYFIQKPFSMTDMAAKVREALESE